MPALAKHGIPGIICLFLASLVTAAIAQVPDRPVRVFIPYAAGGPADVIVRNLAQRITASGGPTFVVENKTGGGGVIAALATKQSPPDGTTLFLTDLPTFAINPNLLVDFPLDPVGDFKPLTLLFAFPSLLVVPADLKANSVADLVALARNTPGGLAYGSQGQGSGGQLLAEMFSKAAGVPFVHVPYRGSAQAYPRPRLRTRVLHLRQLRRREAFSRRRAFARARCSVTGAAEGAAGRADTRRARVSRHGA